MITAATTRGHRVMPLAQARRFAWIGMVVAGAGLIAWGALAALVPECPGACMTNGYETFSSQPWGDFRAAFALQSNFVLLLFRVFGAYNVAFGLLGVAVAATAFRRGEVWAWWALLVANTIAYGSAMTYDRMVGFIGTNELLEYVCLAGVFVAAILTAPIQARPARQPS
jgi:hypothetical protein